MFPATAPANWRPDFWIADVDRAAATAAERGGGVVEPPADVPGAPFKSAVVADPYGAAFSLSQLVVEAWKKIVVNNHISIDGSCRRLEVREDLRGGFRARGLGVRGG